MENPQNKIRGEERCYFCSNEKELDNLTGKQGKLVGPCTL